MTPDTLSAAAASLVEFIEALTVVLAVAATRGLRSAAAGVLAALAFLAVLVALFGPVLRHVPVAPAQVVFGTLFMLFGTRWLRKATRRGAGVIPLRDETAAFRRHRGHIAAIDTPVGRWDGAGMAVAFQATAIEGLEVAFIVVAVGSGGSGLLAPAVLGAVAALCLVVTLGVALYRPITRVPENALNRFVGAMLAGLGTFWVGEGAGLRWPGEDIWIVLLGLGFLLLSAVLAARLRRASRARPMNLLRRILAELWSLFVDDPEIAALIVGWIVVACAVMRRLPPTPWSGPVLFAGLAAIVAYGIRPGQR